MLEEYSMWLEKRLNNGDDYIDLQTYCSMQGLEYIKQQVDPIIAPTIEHKPVRSCCGGGVTR